MEESLLLRGRLMVGTPSAPPPDCEITPIGIYVESPLTCPPRGHPRKERVLVGGVRQWQLLENRVGTHPEYLAHLRAQKEEKQCVSLIPIKLYPCIHSGYESPLTRVTAS